METLIFVLLAAVSIASAFGLLLSRNAIYAALFLILNFGTVAVFYLLLNAPFLAAIRLACIPVRSWCCFCSSSWCWVRKS